MNGTTATRYRTDLARLAAALFAHRRTFSRAASDGRKERQQRHHRRLRQLAQHSDLTQRGWAAGPILCGICSQPFCTDD